MGRHTHAAPADLSRITVVLEIAGAPERDMAVEQAVAESPLFAGNEVSILSDGIGSLWTPTDFFTRLQNAGIQVVQLPTA